MEPTMMIQYEFHGVGQGLFCSGFAGDFHWVYDCGSFDKKMRNSAIDRYQPPHNKIDLLAISHFHIDHTNGIPALIDKGIKINTVLIPYLSPCERACVLLDIISNDNSPIEEYCLRFLHSPAQYFHDAKIIYVKPAGENPDENGENNAFDLGDGDFTDKLDNRDQWGIGGTEKIKRIESGILKKDDYFFIPYYDTSQLKLATDKFEQCEYSKEFKDFFTNPLLDSSLNDIYKIIEKIRQERKIIFPCAEKYSMCLLGIPKYENELAKKNISDIERCVKECSCCNEQENCPKRIHPGVLYTGDAPLKAQKSIDGFKKYYDSYLKNILCFQVMHHGSKYNCANNFAEDVNPCFSIFSANPDCFFEHPHRETLLEFIDNHPILVNQKDYTICISGNSITAWHNKNTTITR